MRSGEMLQTHVRSGMENARAKGRRIGRPQVSKEDIPTAFLRHYPAHKNGQFNISELARVCDISRTNAYKYKSLLEALKDRVPNLAPCLISD